MSWLHRLIYNTAWPSYDCCLCIGQDWWQGCHCHYYGAAAPGQGPNKFQVLMRRLWTVVARRGGYYDPNRTSP